MKPASMNRTVLLNVMGTSLYQGINLLMLPVLTRLLGTSGYGLLSVYVATQSILTTICGFQTYACLIHIAVQVPKERQSAYISSVQIFSLVSFLAIDILILAFARPISAVLGVPAFLIGVLLVHAFGDFCINFATTKFIQFRETRRQLYLSVGMATLTSVLSVVLIFAIGAEGGKIYGRIIGLAAPTFIVGGAFFLGFLVKGRFLYLPEAVREYVPMCLFSVVVDLAQQVISQGNRFILQRFADASDVGIFSFSYTLGSLLMILWRALNYAWKPHFFEWIKNGELELVRRRSVRLIKLYTMGFIAFLLVAPEFALAMGGKSFAEGTRILPVVAGGMYFMFLFSFDVGYLTYHRRTDTVALNTGITAVFSIAANYFLIRLWGGAGAAFATFLTFGFSLVLHALSAKALASRLGQSYSLGNSTYVFASIVSIASVAFLYFVTLSPAVRWLGAAVLAVLVVRRMAKDKLII